MENKKKLLSVFLCGAMALSMVGCGNTDESEKKTTTKEETTTTTTVATTKQEEGTTTVATTTTAPEVTDEITTTTAVETETTLSETETTTTPKEETVTTTTPKETTVTTTKAPVTTTKKTTTKATTTKKPTTTTKKATTTKPVTTTKKPTTTLPAVDATPEEIENSKGWLIIEEVQYKGQTVVGCSKNAYGKIVIPEGVESIGEYAFANCPNVTTVIMPSTLDSYYLAAFNKATGLECIIADAKYYSSKDGLLYNKEKTNLLRYPEGKKGNSFTIPSSVTAIAPHAFSNCKQLESITIPNGVTYIDWCAFNNCTGLKSITLPDSVNCIIIDAFIGCTDITVNYKGKAYSYDELYEIYSVE